MAGKRILRVKFTDFWTNFILAENLFFNLLNEKYRLHISDDPQLVIYSVFSNQFLDYKCPRLCYAGENRRINFDECDFAFGYDYLADNPNYQRLPLWVLYGDPKVHTAPRPPAEQTLADKTGFCSVVVSNGDCQERNEFFAALSHYKQVASGGGYLNNVGGRVPDKHDFVRRYKFSMVFENGSYPGYTTEKLLDGLVANTVPIYWGNPRAGEDFNPKAFLNYHDFASPKRLIERVIELDGDDDAYRAMLREPIFADNRLPQCAQYDYIARHLDHVVEQVDQVTPVATTTRGRIAATRRRAAGAVAAVNAGLRAQARRVLRP